MKGDIKPVAREDDADERVEEGWCMCEEFTLFYKPSKSML
jgi:hypothetical protein